MSAEVIGQKPTRRRSKNTFTRSLTDRSAIEHPENKRIVPNSVLAKARDIFTEHGRQEFKDSVECADLEAEMLKARKEGNSCDDFRRDFERNFLMNPKNRQGTSIGSESSDLDDFRDAIYEVAENAWTKQL